ncbi:MAG: hypothetical protein IJY52_07825 [Anaerotignum sp.]|nr:hypothetical protein [Anaerotignum sp.]
MFLFPAEGIMYTILSYGQLISLFLVLMIFEAMIAAKSETAKPGLVFIGLTVLLAVFVGYYFGDFHFFLFMLIPVAMCFLAFYIARRQRAKNIARGAVYNEDGLIEDELNKMQQR